jgi:hypothetical protein
MCDAPVGEGASSPVVNGRPQGVPTCSRLDRKVREDVSHTRRTATLLRIAGTGSAALALGLGASGTSFAEGHGWNGHQAGFSASHAQPTTAGAGGDCAISTSDSLVPTASGTVQITVSTSGQASCDVSLASYLTEGATWATSGTQTLVDVAHVTVQPGQSAKLSVKVPDAGCFGQIDLYKGSKVFSGDNAPHYPHGVFNGDSGLIKSWNGGSEVCSPTPSTSASATPSGTPSSASPSASDSTSAAPSGSASASASSSTGTGASASASASTSVEASSSASATAAASASATSSGGGLADTGSSGTGTIAGIAGALVVAGGAAVFALRRRAAGNHS